MAAHQAPHPWDAPGKNTGVGCHFLLQCMKVKSESEVTQSCPTLSDPMDCSLPGSSVHGLFQARVLEWGAIAFSEHLSSYLDILSLRTLLTLERQEEKALRITCIPPTPIFNYCWHFAYIFPDYLLCARMFIKNKIIL